MTTAAQTAATSRPAARRTAAPPAVLQRRRRIAVALGVVLYAVLAATASAYVSTALLYLMAKQPLPALAALDPTAIVDAWDATRHDGTAHRKVKAIAALPLLVFGVLLPVMVAAGIQQHRPLHGAARFANRREIEQAGLSTDDGILIGRLGSQYLRLPGQQSVMLSAPTRSGKGVGVVIPNLLAWKGSVVVLDIKGENHQVTAGFRQQHGQTVIRWAPFAADHRSHRWNPLSYIRSDPRHAVGDTLAIAQMLYPGGATATSNETFFAEQARNLFLGLVLLMVATPERPRTIGELLRQSSGQGRPIHEHLRTVIAGRHAEGRPLPDACVDALNRFLSTSENTLSSILATLAAPLTLFADPMVDAATSADDFDLRELRRRRLSVYLVIPANRLADASVLVNLFFAQAISQNTDVLPENDPTLVHPCLFLLDEAAAVGRIPVLAKAIGFLAGYNLRVLTVVQSMSQLESVYGREDARTFATNHAAQILFAPREQRDANEYSDMLGTYTQRERSNGRSVSQGARGSSTSTSHNESSQRRPLLLPQEFKEIGTEAEVIVLENTRPILAEKIRYHADPVFTSRLLPAPLAPQINLDRHVARVEGRHRELEPGEAFEIDDLVADFTALPRLTADASQAEIDAWRDAFLQIRNEGGLSVDAIEAVRRGEAPPAAPPSPSGLSVSSDPPADEDDLGDWAVDIPRQPDDDR